MQLNIASLRCHNFFIIGGILVGGEGARTPCPPPPLPPGYAYVHPTIHYLKKLTLVRTFFLQGLSCFFT